MVKIQFLRAFVVLSFLGLLSSIGVFASPPSPSKRSQSDRDISAIGHRKIDHGPNYWSAQQESELGRQLDEEVERHGRLVHDAAITDYVQRLAQDLARNSDTQMRIQVGLINNEEVYALTQPGGYQYITRGLVLRLEGEGELAALLARGVAHTALDSAMKEMFWNPVASLPNHLVVNGLDSIPRSTPIFVKQDDELNADYFGVQYLYKTGYDPECFLTLIPRVWDSGQGSGKKVSVIFRGFPSVTERLRALNKEISEILPKRDDAIVSTPEFAVFKGRVRDLIPEAAPKPPGKGE